jgi:hypothetical protein
MSLDQPRDEFRLERYIDNMSLCKHGIYMLTISIAIFLLTRHLQITDIHPNPQTVTETSDSSH